MSCNNCNNCNNNKRLNPCGECQYILNTDCVIYNDDLLDFEPSSVQNGSSRTLTEILQQIPSESCCTRISKEVTGNYTVVVEDVQKILLLNGNTDTEADNTNVSYTIILPESESFIGKTLIIKDISELTSGTPGGRVVWSFDTSVQYKWTTDTSSTLFDTLISWDYSLHRTLYLTYVKIGINYQWIVINDAHPDTVKTIVSDDDMANGFVTGGSGSVKYCKQGNLVTLEGYLTEGESGTTAFTLPVSFRPSTTASFLCQYDDLDFIGLVNILSSGLVQISIPGESGNPLTGNLSLWGINFLID